MALVEGRPYLHCECTWHGDKASLESSSIKWLNCNMYGVQTFHSPCFRRREEREVLFTSHYKVYVFIWVAVNAGDTPVIANPDIDSVRRHGCQRGDVGKSNFSIQPCPHT